MRIRIATCATLVAAVLAGISSAHAAASSEWPMYAHDPGGSRVNAAEGAFSRSHLSHGLAITWRQRTVGPVYGTPAVADGTVYAADIAGNVYAFDARTGSLHWLAHVGPVATFAYVVTSSPLVTGRSVIVGDQSGVVWALDRATGLVRWAQRPNTVGYPAIYGSPTMADVVVRGHRRALVLVPIASNEETFTASKEQPCCMFRGSIAALDPESGAVVWQTYTVSEAAHAQGASGVSIWSTPTYDRTSNRVYVTTGNNYGDKDGTPTTKTSEAILALDAATGQLLWASQETPDDTWTYAYRGFAPGHVDADFGDSAKVFDLAGRRVVAAGQKSGFLHVVDAVTGAPIARRQFVPAGGLGGLFADSADRDGVIFAPGNDWTDYGGGELGAVAGSPPPKAGVVVAVRVGPGGRLEELWRFTTPGSPMLGAIAVAGTAVFVQTTRTGTVFALDAATGGIVAHVAVGPAVNGPAIADGHLYVGTGDVAGLAASDPTSGSVVAIGPRA